MELSINMIDTFKNSKEVTLLKVFFRGAEFPGYLYRGVIYENRDNEPLHFAIKRWEEISTAQHENLCRKWKLI